jgi:hypothetical protein
MNGAALRLVLILVAFVVLLTALVDAFNTAVASAACLERANFEMILCDAAPEPWSIGLLLLAVIVLSAMAGRELGSARVRPASHQAERNAPEGSTLIVALTVGAILGAELVARLSGAFGDMPRLLVAALAAVMGGALGLMLIRTWYARERRGTEASR